MTPQIELRDVTVVRTGQTILEHIDLDLFEGERLALVGQNGAGKTTLLRAIVGLQPIASGTITAFGKLRRTEQDFRRVRVRAGYLFQDPDDQLFCPTVLEDVAFGPLNLGLEKRAAIEKARSTLDRLELDHLADRITHRLSGGEKRLITLAAVLAMDPDVLLLDEPTNALDDRHLKQLTNFLDGLSASMIIVSHDRQFTERLATRAVLIDGRRLSPAVVHRHPHVHDHVHFHEEAATHDGGSAHVSPQGNGHTHAHATNDDS
ncbi:MAG: cobalt transporter ATP-binding protein [Pseudomonadota bacterium]|jgi:cobalt/nickel transport system ATP-binding protein